MPNKGAKVWWSARIDCHEYLPNEPLRLEFDEDTDPSSDDSDEDADQASGPTEGIASSEVPYVASRLDNIMVRSLILPQEGSQWGFDADTLLVGQHFPTKMAVQ